MNDSFSNRPGPGPRGPAVGQAEEVAVPPDTFTRPAPPRHFSTEQLESFATRQAFINSIPDGQYRDTLQMLLDVATGRRPPLPPTVQVPQRGQAVAPPTREQLKTELDRLRDDLPRKLADLRGRAERNEITRTVENHTAANLRLELAQKEVAFNAAFPE